MRMPPSAPSPPAHVAGTEPYPWPYDGCLDPGRLALVAVGCQRWGLAATTGGGQAPATLETIDGLAERLRSRGALVVFVRHAAPAGPRRSTRGWAPRLPVRGSPEWQLVLRPRPLDLVVDATGIDAFFASSLEADLRSLGRDHLAVGGLGLETCVYSTITAANDRGLEALALRDAAAAYDPGVGERALASISMSGGIFGAIGLAGALINALPPLDPSGDSPERQAERSLA